MSMGVQAPELNAGLAWLNTDRPLRFAKELRGQIVVLDFWTYCCINCMHILPDLAYLEEKYAKQPVTFIGVHCAKFSNEASRETIRAAMLRYEIAHPVVVDDQMKIWRSYAVRSWPTVIIVDAAGYMVGNAAGEGNRELLDAAIAAALDSGRAAGALAAGPLRLKRDVGVRAVSGLAFPGKVLAYAADRRLYVADSNHNRIVIAELPDASGKSRVVRVVGSGRVGREDGPGERATFHHPQGLATGHGKLYVADTENHLIRAIDLTTWLVTTVAGTGQMSNDRAGGGMGTQQGLNSPWDLAIEGSTLYVAMAGTHQIWRIDLPVGFARALAGSGRENIVDGPVETAALAQPSGICLAGGKIYFADSEVSAIRGIDLSTEQLFTVIGDGLFSFGDVDGKYPQVKLQHPLGVAAWKQSLLIADTYNHKIKRVEPAARTAATLYGTGTPGASTTDGRVAFFDPGGLSVCGDQLFVADTNNHRVIRIDLVSGDWYEIAFSGLESPLESAGESESPTPMEAVAIAANQDVELVLNIQLLPESHINPEAPWSIRAAAGGKTIIQRTGKSDAVPLRVVIPAATVVTDQPWEIVATFAYCTDSDRGVCIPARIVWRVPVRTGGRSTTVALRGAVADCTLG